MLHPGSATVVRTAQVAPGMTQVVFSGLPARFDVQTLRAERDPVRQFLMFWPLSKSRTRVDVVHFGRDWGDAPRPAGWDPLLAFWDIVMAEDLRAHDGVLDEVLRHATADHQKNYIQGQTNVLVASGTATLEAALFKRPLVISYVITPWMRRIMAWRTSGSAVPPGPVERWWRSSVRRNKSGTIGLCHAIRTPISSRRPPGLLAASVRSRLPVSGSEAMVKPVAQVSAQRSASAAGSCWTMAPASTRSRSPW